MLKKQIKIRQAGRKGREYVENRKKLEYDAQDAVINFNFCY